MKTNNQNFAKLVPISVLAPVMCFSVVLSHIHAKDAVPLMSQPAGATQLASRDITAKALGDLHHHIDKASVKNVHNDAATTARHREFQSVVYDGDDASLLEQIQEFILRLRVVASLVFQAI